jgi:predicted transcriptional regulator of viral defense system
MDYENQILKFMKNNSDSITIEEINKLNIPRITLTRLVNKGLIERVKTGLYVLKNSWGDEYFNLIYGSNYAIYSHLTSLYFNDLCERVPMEYDITVKQNYAGNLRKEKKVKLYYVSDEQYDLGLIQIKSPQGRIIKCYDAERCFCDLIKCKDKIYLEYLKYAFNEYYKVQKKDTKKLYEYAKKLNVYDKVKEFMEVFI